VTTATPPNADPQAIRQGLAVLFEPGDVVELRAFRNRRCTISGYYDDHDKLATDAAKVNRTSGTVYVTLNRIVPDLLARRANRFKEYAATTTNDDHVIRRHWLPIDLDAERPADISSTDSEHDTAIQRAREIRTFLVKLWIAARNGASFAAGGGQFSGCAMGREMERAGVRARSR